MLTITNETIKKMNPCKDRYNNYLEHYRDKEYEVMDFLDLDKITHNDKLWVVTKLLTRNQAVAFSILVAESVLHIFESKYQENKSVRNLLDYMKSINDFNNLTEEQKDKIAELRSTAYYYAAAAYTADAAYTAAADAADAAYAAAAAAAAANANAAAAYADAAAAAAADAADRNREEEQEQLNLQFLKMVLRG